MPAVMSWHGVPAACICRWTTVSGVPGWTRTAEHPSCPAEHPQQRPPA